MKMDSRSRGEFRPIRASRGICGPEVFSL